MKKIGLIAGLSFLAGALFFALTSGHLQKSEIQGTIFSPDTVQAEAIKVDALNFAPLVKKVRPAVVKVFSEKIVQRWNINRNDFFDRFFRTPRSQEPVEGLGSGFIISADGYIITNNHVVEQAKRVRIVTIDKQEFVATIIGTDPATDLALIKVKGKNLPFIELGDSDKAEIGEWVLAIGNPFYQDLSVTAGIISAKGRQLRQSNDVYEDFIQTDAAINRGNSGGPLVNMAGNVIGITSQIIGPSGGNVGIGFAIPSNMAKKVIRALKKEGRVIRGHLGISIQERSEAYAKEFDLASSGLVIVKVEKNSPAESVGLEKNDIIIKFNGKPIKSSNKLRTEIADMGPGKIIELTVMRGKKEMTFKTKIGERPDTVHYQTQGETRRSISIGMELTKNNRSIAREYELSTSRGLVVMRVESNSAASRAKLRKLDVILEINGRPVTTLDEFRNFLSKKKPGSRVLLYVNRRGKVGDIILQLPE